MTPLTPAVLHILLALADGERHGYAIAQEVEAATEGQLPMGPGTLYGSIQRMLAGGLILESTRVARTSHDDSRRRYYKIAARGRRALKAELQRLQQIVAIGRNKRLLRDPELA